MDDAGVRRPRTEFFCKKRADRDENCRGRRPVRPLPPTACYPTVVFTLPRPGMNFSRTVRLSGWTAAIAVLACAPARTSPVPAHPPFPADYRCVPFHDARYSGGAQTIPGRVQNEYYDRLDGSVDVQKGGVEEGQCYHDTDNANSGSGALNGTGTYENEFRMFESPDFLFVKLGPAGVAIDDSPYNLVKPDSNALYLGWIAPGEWVRYTVSVARDGWYSITTAYTCKFGGHVSLAVED